MKDMFKFSWHKSLFIIRNENLEWVGDVTAVTENTPCLRVKTISVFPVRENPPDFTTPENLIKLQDITLLLYFYSL